VSGAKQLQEIDRALVKEVKGEKVIVIHTLQGDIVLGEKAANSTQESRATLWRPLSSFKYPTQNFEHDFSVNFAAHLVFHLHRTFRSTGYTKFTSLIETDETTVSNVPVTVINLISQYARYTGAIRTGVKRLWDASEDRVALQEEQKTELISLQKTWSVNVKVVPVRHGIIGYDFVYDPDGHAVSIEPSWGSTNPVDYPNQMTRTSELLSFVAAHLNESIAIVNFDYVFRSYPLFKLMLELLDHHGITIENIRCDAANPEEWDYVNTAIDQEVGKVARHRDYSKD
jgi:hypothetical protein